MMKSNKSKHEILTNYLRQKNYTKKILTQSTEDFLMDVSLKSEISRTNSFSYSNIVGLNSNGSLLVDQQFGKLLLFVQSQNDQQIRKDLEQLLPPLLCHLYLEILKGKEWKPAIEFLRKYSVILGQIEQAPLMPIPTQQQSSPHQRVNGTLEDPSATASNIPINYVCSYVKQQQRLLNQIHSHLHQKPSHFLPNLNPENANTFRELVRELSMLQKMQDIEFSALIANFRSSKHQVKLGLSTLPVMIDFLSKHSHVLILQTLHTWFHIDATQLDESEEEPKIRSASANPNNLSRSKNSNHNSKNSSCNNNTSNSFNDQYNYQNEMLNDFVKDEIGENLKLKRLQETFKQINSSYHMPIRIFNINNTDNSLCSVNVDKQFCHLAAGFEDSKIVLWSLSSNENYGRKPYRMPVDRLCDWSINNCDRFMVDDISDYSSSDEEDKSNVTQPDSDICEDVESATTSHRKKIKISKKDRENVTLRQQWQKYTFKSCSENSFSNSSITLRGHRKAVTDLMFSNQHNVLLSTSRDTTLRLWKADSYTCASVYRGHNYPIWCVDEGSNYIATGSKDTTARLWSYDRKYPLKTYVGHVQDVDCIAFHPNGNYIATGSTDTTIRLWCVTSGKVLRILTECHLPVNAISFSPDGKYLAAAGDEAKIRIFDLAAGHQLMDLKKNYSAPTKHLSWSTNSKKLLSACTDGSFFVWNINTHVSSSSSSRDSKSSSSSAQSSTPSTSMQNSTNSKEKSHSLLQSNLATGCKRILKISFDSTSTYINCIGND